MACSSLSSTSTPAPSPITKPERSASKGLLAVFGLSFELVHLLRAGWRWGGVGMRGGGALVRTLRASTRSRRSLTGGTRQAPQLSGRAGTGGGLGRATAAPSYYPRGCGLRLRHATLGRAEARPQPRPQPRQALPCGSRRDGGDRRGRGHGGELRQAARPSGVMDASVPPASKMSDSPYWMYLSASPMA